MKNRSEILMLILPVLACFAFLPGAQGEGEIGTGNTVEGLGPLFSNINGTFNTALGWYSLYHNSTGNFNTGVGASTLFNNNGGGNTAVGGAVLFHNTSGSFQTAVGFDALLANTTGGFNTAIGWGTLSGLVSGTNNVAIGWAAGDALGGSESGNIYIGAGQTGSLGENQVIRIGGSNSGTSACFLGSDPNAGQGSAVVHLGGTTSIIVAGGILGNFMPPALGNQIVTISSGGVLGYTTDTAANKVVEQQKEIEEQQASIAELKSMVTRQQNGMEVLTAQLKEQAAQIQKVSAQVELSKTAPETVLNK